jgi:hypothetical protein
VITGPGTRHRYTSRPPHRQRAPQPQTAGSAAPGRHRPGVHRRPRPACVSRPHRRGTLEENRSSKPHDHTEPGQDSVAHHQERRQAVGPRMLSDRRILQGWNAVYVPARRDNSATYRRISTAPSEQFTPATRGSACSSEAQNASNVCPDSVRPLRSTIVTEIHNAPRQATGRPPRAIRPRSPALPPRGPGSAPVRGRKARAVRWPARGPSHTLQGPPSSCKARGSAEAGARSRSDPDEGDRRTRSK